MANLKKILITASILWGSAAHPTEILRISFAKNNVIADQFARAELSGTPLSLQPGNNEFALSPGQGYIMLYQGNLPIRFICWQSAGTFSYEQKRLLAVQTGIWSGGCVYLRPTTTDIELRSFYHNATDHNKDHFLLLEALPHRESADQRILRTTFTNGEEKHLDQAELITDRFGKTYTYPLENLPAGIYFLRKGKNVYVYRKTR